MPKPKPDEVIRHEIVLGRSERDLLEGYLYGSELNKAAKTAVDALSDATFVGLLGALIGGYVGYNFIVDEYDVPSMLNQFKDMAELAAQPGPLAGAIITEVTEEAGVEKPGSLAAQMALAGYPPTTVNFIRYFLFGLPGVEEGLTI